MTTGMTILPCRDPALLARLVPLATAEGFHHLERLVTEWADGTNRFECDGEAILIIDVGGITVACGGLTRQREALGRVRRVYVDPAFRRQGLGRLLLEPLVEHARRSFDALVLYADNPDAARFYERLGFLPQGPESTADRATHRLCLRAE